MKTPARVGAPPLWLSVLALARRRIEQEHRSSALYRRSLERPRAKAFIAAPKDLRPADGDVGRRILGGSITLAGADLDFQAAGDPWDMPSPSRRFAVDLHRFAWLPDLMAEGAAGEREALRLFQRWAALFDRISPFTWAAETLERRVFNLACASGRLSKIASEAETDALAALLAVQARHLLRLATSPARAAERAVAGAIAGAALAGAPGDRLLALALTRLSSALASNLWPDGGLKTRSPEQGLELLYDLLTLDDVLLQRGAEAPKSAYHAIDRLTQASRFFRLSDGRLSPFQGGEALGSLHVQGAIGLETGGARAPASLPHTGYHRLTGRMLEVVVDAALPADGAFSLAACAQPLAMVVVCGEDRLIDNPGWSPDAIAPQSMRLTDAASTAALGERSTGSILSGLAQAAFGPRLIGRARRVHVERNEDKTGQWLELAHDGWADDFGLLHERRLYLDVQSDELRGEDRFMPIEQDTRGSWLQRRRAERGQRVNLRIRFHLRPDVRVSLALDKRSVLLRGPSNRGWWLRNDAAEVLLEPSVHFHRRIPQRTLQIVLKTPVGLDGESRVRWKLAPVDPGEGRAAVGKTAS